ncbi:MAG: ester cyclase [Polyangiaceae bacterium]
MELPHSRSPLLVAPALASSWAQLPSSVRWYLDELLDGASSIEDPRLARTMTWSVGNCHEHRRAPELSHHIEALALAFPQRQRQLVTLMATDSKVSCRVTLRGVHLGPLYGLFLPTQRELKTEITHHIVCLDGRIQHDSIAVDVPAVLRQLSRGPKLARAAE